MKLQTSKVDKISSSSMTDVILRAICTNVKKRGQSNCSKRDKFAGGQCNALNSEPENEI